MPQMAPLPWVTLLLLTIFTLLLLSTIIFFSFKGKMDKSLTTQKKTFLIKW